MNRLRITVFVVALCCFIVSTAITPVTAMQNRDESDIDGARFLDLSVFNTISSERTIQCFDVNEQGWFAIGYRGNKINVYDQNGDFQYGYQFSCNGDYGITLLSENIIIYIVRGGTIAEFDPEGKLVSVEKAIFTQDIMNNIICRTSKLIGSTTYSLERDIGFFSGDYSRLVSTQENGEREVLYDVTPLGYLFGIFHYLVLVAFPVLGFLAIHSAIKKEDESNNTLEVTND
jgi:hypothetical protein